MGKHDYIVRTLEGHNSFYDVEHSLVCHYTVNMGEQFTTHITETRLEADGFPRLGLAIPLPQMPLPGQYFRLHHPADDTDAVGHMLFPAGIHGESISLAPPFPAHWQPGDRLQANGPLGHGFTLPQPRERVALVGLDVHIARLAPILAHAGNCEIAIFTDAVLPRLPASVEANPLKGASDALNWAERWLFDIPISKLGILAELLTIPPTTRAEALVTTTMPCAGIGECGVCAIPDARGKIRLACTDGPVFDWKALVENPL